MSKYQCTTPNCTGYGSTVNTYEVIKRENPRQSKFQRREEVALKRPTIKASTLTLVIHITPVLLYRFYSRAQRWTQEAPAVLIHVRILMPVSLTILIPWRRPSNKWERNSTQFISTTCLCHSCSLSNSNHFSWKMSKLKTVINFCLFVRDQQEDHLWVCYRKCFNAA